MLRKIKWILTGIVVLIVALFLNYVMPHHNTVRVTNVYNKLTHVDTGISSIFYASPDSGSAASATGDRDILFIQTVRPNGKVLVFRNEDTGWIWPPYFKYDSSNLQAEAANAVSQEPNAKWVSVTSYGWRIAWLSAFPNAVRIVPVAGPEATIFPWLNIVILGILLLIVLLIRAMWLQFRQRTIDPLLEDASEAWDEVEERADAAGDHARGIWGRFTGWLGTWSGKPRK